MNTYEHDDVLVIEPDAYMDLSFKEAVLPVARRHVDDGGRAVLMDCGGVDLINSYGISALLSIYDRLDQTGGTLAFTRVESTLVENALTISGLADCCEDHFYPSVDEALAELADS